MDFFKERVGFIYEMIFCSILNGSRVIFYLRRLLRLVAFIDIYLQKTTNFVEKNALVVTQYCLPFVYMSDIKILSTKDCLIVMLAIAPGTLYLH